MKSIIFSMFLLLPSSASATTKVPESLDQIVHDSSEIAVARIETFVGYKETSELVVIGDLATGCCSSDSISMKLRITSLLLGTQLRPEQLIEIALPTNDVSTLSGMQALFTNTEIIIFLKNTPKGLRPVAAL
jgi:hypothetical protein